MSSPHKTSELDQGNQILDRVNLSHQAGFDMQGNAYEWCYDVSEHYPVDSEEAIEDASGTEEVSDAVARSLRGGSFYSLSSFIRSASRNERAI